MQYEQDSVPHPGEIHRYFPEWADRPASGDRLLEADHNSYLAGGYSEEFGYRLRPDRPPVFALLAGDPDRSRQWGVQIGGLHPGYPECARPADRAGLLREASGEGAADAGDRTDAGGRRDGGSRDRLAVLDGATVRDGAERRVGGGRVFQVRRAGIERRVGITVPIAALWIRLRVRRRAREEAM